MPQRPRDVATKEVHGGIGRILCPHVKVSSVVNETAALRGDSGMLYGPREAITDVLMNCVEPSVSRKKLIVPLELRSIAGQRIDNLPI